MSAKITALAVVSLVALAASTASAADAAHPAVVELFTSQGCSSCAPAHAAVNQLNNRPDVLTLSFGVTYWDQLGWKDTFAQPRFTERQRLYELSLRHPQMFTPQVVVNGRLDTVGVNMADIQRLIAQGRPPGPDVRVVPGLVQVGAGNAPPRGADVWLVRYDPRLQQVPIRRGELGGKTLPQVNVVRSLDRIGTWTGRAASFRIPAAPAGLSTAVLVQVPASGPILAAVRG